MAFYDYSCRECDFVFEIRHGINEKPNIVCPRCGSSKTFKMVSSIGIIVRSNRAKSFVMDEVKRETDKREELRGMGIENVVPMAGVTLDQVYGEIKRQGSAVKEKMQAGREENENKRIKRSREWRKKALRITTERAKIRQEKQAQEDYIKRSIRL